MDGIETRVYCPECKQELDFILEKVEIPEELLLLMKTIGIESPGHEIAFKGQKQCSCGKFIKATYCIEVMDRPDIPNIVVTRRTIT
ncbi:MAG: hypothetical protein LBQ73_05015 [Tannerellaceae bacterium]|jgi:hypothetical protein|nr:hypothetical protein [Tannerellaceae bacterium]